MYIIFGNEQAQTLSENYTVLALDTFRFIPDNVEKTAYAVIENIPITDMPEVAGQKDMHAKLIENYQNRNWNYCEQAIEELTGAWNNELDSFYSELQSRINNYKENDPGEHWDYAIEKIVSNPLQS